LLSFASQNKDGFYELIIRNFFEPSVLALSDNTNAFSFHDFFGPRFSPAPSVATNQAPKNAVDSIHRWNSQSRIYLGIHWQFDKTQSIPPGPQRRQLRLRPHVPAPRQ